MNMQEMDMEDTRCFKTLHQISTQGNTNARLQGMDMQEMDMEGRALDTIALAFKTHQVHKYMNMQEMDMKDTRCLETLEWIST